MHRLLTTFTIIFTLSASGCAAVWRESADDAADKFDAGLSATLSKGPRLAKAAASCAYEHGRGALSEAVEWLLPHMVKLAVSNSSSPTLAVRDLGKLATELGIKHGIATALCLVDAARPILCEDDVPQIVCASATWVRDHARVWAVPLALEVAGGGESGGGGVMGAGSACTTRDKD